MRDGRKKRRIRGKIRQGRAVWRDSRALPAMRCGTFLIVNISSLQLIPINMIAYRSQYGSVSPAAIAGPALLATIASTAAGITFCKVMDRKNVDF